MLMLDRPGVPRPFQSSPVRGREWLRSDLGVLAALIVVGAVVRFATIASQSYWVDEATTAHEMQLSFGALLHAVRTNETTPPLYFVVAWLWTKVFGTGEVGLRSLSALLGTAVIPLSYLCARELVSRRAGVVAAALAALSPFMIWYSQEARSYMLLATLCGLSFLFFARALREPSTRNLVCWAVSSALGVLTHFFAGFLVAPEAIWLLIVVRRRMPMLASVAAVAAVQVAVVPLALADTKHPLGWIKAFPLGTRINQVPVDLGLASLYQSSIVTEGLLGALLLGAAVVALLALGGGRLERRGAAVAAGVAAPVILVPLVLALLGRDYYVPRNLTPAWIPLAVLLAAACTVPRTRAAGAALIAVVLGGFVLANIQIADNSQYQRPNWNGVAAALGHATGARAIVAYDGRYAAEPLAIYLPGVPWPRSTDSAATVREVDVVGSRWQTLAPSLPPGTRLIATKLVDDFRVARFSVRPSWRLTPTAIGSRATGLLGPAPPGPAVLIQHSSATV